MNTKRVKRIGGWRAMLVAFLLSVGTVAALPVSAFAAPANVVQQSNAIVYVVQRGDTLSAIARAYGVSVKTLAAYNGLANPNRIYVGQTIYIPTSGGNPPPSSCRLVYPVVRGDTLSAIARFHGTTVGQLQSANGIANPNYIEVGQRLCIP